MEGFAFIPITSFALAMTTFIGQNLGAGQYDRAKKGARFGILTSILLAELVGVAVYFAAPALIAAFNSEPQVVAYGVRQAHTISLFYFLLAFSHSLAGILRGAGRSIVPMLVMMVCWCAIRVSYITVVTRFVGEIQAIFWAYPITWALSSLAFLAYYLKGDWVHFYDRQREKAGAAPPAAE